MKLIQVIGILTLAFLLTGIVSATEATFSPIANGSSSNLSTSGDTYAAVRNGPGNVNFTNSATIFLQSRATPINGFRQLWRSELIFDTSSIPDDATITSVDLFVHPHSLYAITTPLGFPDYMVTGYSPAIDNVISNGDYERYIDTDYSNRIGVASFSNTSWTVFNLTTAGKTAINRTGPTPLMIRDSWDRDNLFGGTWIAAVTSNQLTLDVFNDTPYLKVNYTPAPVAAFTANQTMGVSPLAVQFTDMSTDAVSWNWTLGDGNVSTLQNPVFTFTTPGTYTIKLNASNGYTYDEEVKTNYITVTTEPVPVTDFSGTPVTGIVPLNVTFTDSSTESPTEWNYTFGDGNYSHLQNPVYRYLAAGTYTVALNATNGGGSNTNTKAAYITVSPMTASFSANDTAGVNPLTVQFTGSSTGVADAWYWEFGDGNTSTSQSPLFVYGVNGTFNVNMRATNLTSGAFDWENKTGYITVSGVPDGFNQQDIEMDPQFTLTLHITDSSTGAAIPVNTVTTSDGQTYTTTNGTAYFTEPYSTVVVYVSSTGYYGASTSYVMDSDRDETIQLTVQTTVAQAANIIWSPQSVAIQVLDANYNPIIGTPVYINAYSSSLPGGFTGAVEYFKNTYGVLDSTAQTMFASNTTYYGTTDSNGFVATQVVDVIQYQIVAGDVYGINETRLMWPAGPYYQIVTANATVAGIAAQGRAQAAMTTSNFNTTFWEPNTSYSCMGVKVYDATGGTTNVYAWWKLADNGTTWWLNSTAIGGYGPINSTKCVPHVPYQQWKWGGITD
jgi:PKD repeat protein